MKIDFISLNSSYVCSNCRFICNIDGIDHIACAKQFFTYMKNNSLGEVKKENIKLVKLIAQIKGLI